MCGSNNWCQIYRHEWIYTPKHHRIHWPYGARRSSISWWVWVKKFFYLFSDLAFVGSFSHNDLPYNLYGRESNMLHNFTFNSNLRENERWMNSSSSHTDLPRLRAGKVGGQVSGSFFFDSVKIDEFHLWWRGCKNPPKYKIHCY